MAERARIARYFAPLAGKEPGAFDLTDDAAFLTPPTGQSLITTTDSVIQNIHVLADATPQQYAQKLVRRNLSDLAAMGATPWRYFLNVHTPSDLGESWFAEFSATLAAEQTEFNLLLAGGDSTSGGETIHLTLTCMGLISHSPLRRDAAQIGDDVYVSGTIGDAALGLDLLRSNSAAISESNKQFLLGRYHLPQPRLALGQALHGVATSCIDISDGLLADAQALADASGVQLDLKRSDLPVSYAAQLLRQNHPHFLQRIVAGGDDYELLFTAPSLQQETLQDLAQQLSLPLTCIGQVKEGSGVHLYAHDGSLITLDSPGYEHS